MFFFNFVSTLKVSLQSGHVGAKKHRIFFPSSIDGKISENPDNYFCGPGFGIGINTSEDFSGTALRVSEFTLVKVSATSVFVEL